MPLTNPNKVVTEERLNEYHRTILPYLGGNSMVACGGGYAPIGTVISYMGTSAPSDFLICDGTVYNIADYTELADFFEAQFGSSNFFGGNGNTTFAVPDLRGEFLRGTGTNSHTNQGSGANVGVHQDGTEHINIYSDNNQITILSNSNASYSNNNNDSIVQTATLGITPVDPRKDTSFADQSRFYTSRPTNTSVLYCIKAKSQGNGYSLDEQIVGTWIDGKPIYQKTLVVDTIPTSGGTISLQSLAIDNYVLLKTISHNATDVLSFGASYKDPWCNISITYNKSSSNLTVNYDNFYPTLFILTIQYTKNTD